MKNFKKGFRYRMNVFWPIDQKLIIISMSLMVKVKRNDINELRLFFLKHIYFLPKFLKLASFKKKIHSCKALYKNIEKT